MNNISLVGRLTAEPEIAEDCERPVCRMRIAVRNGPRYPATYIDVRAFDEQAYACAEYLVKGQRIGVSGQLAYNEWRSPEGEHRERYSVVGNVDFLDRAPAGQAEKEAAEPPYTPEQTREELLAA
jgi:single stranded DNA-binding protein